MVRKLRLATGLVFCLYRDSRQNNIFRSDLRHGLIYSGLCKLPRYQDYSDHVTQKKRSVLPPKLQADIVKLSKAIHGDRNIHTPLSSYITGIRALPAATVARASTEVQDAGGLYRRWDTIGKFWQFFRPARHPTLKAELVALKNFPQLCHLFIFHGDGRLREAAMKCLDEPPDNPFAFAAIAYRLNDWVEQVRDSAYDCANRLFPHVSAAVVAEASFFLLTQIQHFGRWGMRERGLLESALYRGDVTQALAKILMQRPAGHVGTILRAALRQQGLDEALFQLAHEAALPHIRAIAYEALILRRAQWLVGYRHVWIDKQFGLRRRVPRTERRAVEHPLDIEELIAEAAKDNAVAVRKIAARGLIDLRNELSSEMIDVGKALSKDKSSSVRSRAEFYLKNTRN